MAIDYISKLEKVTIKFSNELLVEIVSRCPTSLNKLCVYLVYIWEIIKSTDESTAERTQ
jgi:hypothetical protein